jgi:hypothetical protein
MLGQEWQTANDLAQSGAGFLRIRRLAPAAPGHALHGPDPS